MNCVPNRHRFYPVQRCARFKSIVADIEPFKRSVVENGKFDLVELYGGLCDLWTEFFDTHLDLLADGRIHKGRKAQPREQY